MLTLLILIPIIGSIIISFISTEGETQNKILNSDLSNHHEGTEKTIKNNTQLIRQIALITSLINFFISLFLWYLFDSNSTQYQFVSEFNQLNFCHLNFGIDGISLYFVLLTTFVTPVALLSNYTNI